MRITSVGDWTISSNNIKIQKAMKKYIGIFTFAAFAMSFAACTEENLDSPQQGGDPATKTIKLSLETEELSRTVLNQNRDKLSWVEGDIFGFYTDVASDINKIVTYRPDSQDYELTVAGDAKEVYAYYPYGSSNSNKTADAVSLVISEIQSQDAGGVFSGEYYPMVSRTVIEGTNARVVFRPVAGALALNVYGASDPNEKVKSVTFSSSVPMAGRSTVDLTAETVAYIPSATTASVNLEEHVPAAGGKPENAQMHENQIYLVVAKQKYTDGTITVVTTTSKYVFTLTDPIDCTENDFTALNLNLEKSESTNYSYTMFLGNYDFNMNVNGGVETWMWNLSEHPTIENAYTGKMYQNGKWIYDNSIIRFDYVEVDGVPVLQFPLPQVIYADRQVEIGATTATGGYFSAEGAGFGYDLVYNDAAGVERFDFVPNEMSKNLSFTGIWLYQRTGTNSGTSWNWIIPCEGESSLSFVRNKNLFWDLKEQYNLDFTEETVSLNAMPGVEIADIVCSADWLHAEKTETGLTFTVDEYTSSSLERDGSITVTAANGYTATINVNQGSYYSLLGMYNVNCIGGMPDNTMEITEDVANVSYIIKANQKDHIYYIKVEKKDGTLTLANDQVIRSGYIYPESWGGDFAGKELDFIFRCAPNDISYYILGGQFGFDMECSKEDGVISLDFVPNAALDSYSPGACSFGFPAYLAETGGIAFTWHTFKPASGNTYVRITKQ